MTWLKGQIINQCFSIRTRWTKDLMFNPRITYPCLVVMMLLIMANNWIQFEILMMSNQVRGVLIINLQWWHLVLILVPKWDLWTVVYLLKMHTTCHRLNLIVEWIKILLVIMQVKPITSSLTTPNLCQAMETSTQSTSQFHIQQVTPNSNIKQICL